MTNSPLIILLATLQEKDWSDLKEYLSNSFSCLSGLPLELFALLDENRDAWNELSEKEAKAFLNRQHLYEQLYPGEEYKDQRLRRVFMELQTALKGFIAFRASRQGHWLAVEAEYLDYLLHCGAYDLFRKAFDKTLRKLDTSPPRDANLQFLLARLRAMENEYFIHTGHSQDSFDELEEALDRQYLARKLENWTSMRTREKRYPQKHRYSFQKEVERMVEVASDQAWPEVEIWKQVFQLEAADADRGHYESLETTVREQGAVLELGTLRQVRGYMFNFLLRHLRNDRRDDYREVWLLARTMLEEGTLHLSGRLSESFLRAAVQTACLAGEAEWAARFLELYGDDLVGPDREQVLALHRLMVAYYLGQYTTVLRGSAILRYGDPRFDVLLRVLQLKASFDLDQGEDFLRLAESFRKLMQRKKGLGKRFLEAYGTFALLAERLGRQRFVLRKSSETLTNEIRESGTVEKLWLLEKSVF
jgi:hypothetical protein